MTSEQSEEVIAVMRASTGGRADPETVGYFLAGLSRLNYDSALAAASTGSIVWRYFPSWAQFMEIYKAQERLREPAGEQRMDLPPVVKERGIPLFVRRWVAARFLYERFGKKQDLRWFEEQRQYVDAREEKMPDDAWLEEAKRISEKDVWAAVGR